MKNLDTRSVGWLAAIAAVPLTALLGAVLGMEKAPATADTFSCNQFEGCPASDASCTFSKINPPKCRIKCAGGAIITCQSA